MGVLEFLLENKEILENSFEMRGRFIANYFNRLGATRELSALPRDFFKKECYNIKNVLESIKSETDLKLAQGVD